MCNHFYISTKIIHISFFAPKTDFKDAQGVLISEARVLLEQRKNNALIDQNMKLSPLVLYASSIFLYVLFSNAIFFQK